MSKDGAASGNGAHRGTGEQLRHRTLVKEIEDIRLLKQVFDSHGIRGAVFECEVCRDKHYLDWDLILDGLELSLSDAHAPVHEPALCPDPNEYVSWDYAQGLLDAYESFNSQNRLELSLQMIRVPSAFEPQDVSTSADQRNGTGS